MFDREARKRIAVRLVAERRKSYDASPHFLSELTSPVIGLVLCGGGLIACYVPSFRLLSLVMMLVGSVLFSGYFIMPGIREYKRGDGLGTLFGGVLFALILLAMTLVVASGRLSNASIGQDNNRPMQDNNRPMNEMNEDDLRKNMA